MMWILTYRDLWDQALTQQFKSLDDMFDFIISRDLPRFKAKRV